MWAYFKSKDKKYECYGEINRIGSHAWELGEYYGINLRRDYINNWFSGDSITLFYVDWNIEYELETSDIMKIRRVWAIHNHQYLTEDTTLIEDTLNGIL